MVFQILTLKKQYMENSQIIKKLLSKLRQPLHINYICENILKTGVEDCVETLLSLKEKGIIEENNNYYKIKKDDL